MKVYFETGRDYGAPQELEIDFEPVRDTFDSAFEDVEATFVDKSRGISGKVTVFGYNATPSRIGEAVLLEYDSGRYNL